MNLVELKVTAKILQRRAEQLSETELSELSLEISDALEDAINDALRMLRAKHGRKGVVFEVI